MPRYLPNPLFCSKILFLLRIIARKILLHAVRACKLLAMHLATMWAAYKLIISKLTFLFFVQDVDICPKTVILWLDRDDYYRHVGGVGVNIGNTCDHFVISLRLIAQSKIIAVVVVVKWSVCLPSAPTILIWSFSPLIV